MPTVVNLSLPVDDTNYSATEMIQMAKDNGIEYFFVMDSNQKFKAKFGKYIVYKNDAGDERCMVMKLTEESTLEQVY